MTYSIISPYQEPEFNSGVVRPVASLRRGWQLVSDQYFLYVGLCAVIVILVSCVPFTGLLWGAWMSGIFGAMLARMHGERAGFGNTVSRGFNFFGPGIIVTILSNLPFIPFAVGLKLLGDLSDQIDRKYPADTPVPDEEFIFGLEIFGGLLLYYAIAFVITGLIFPFAYQLVVDKDMKGWAAVKLSARAARANFGGVLGLVMLDLLLSTLGVLLCCIGLPFVMPWTRGAWTVAYRDVFPAPPEAEPMQSPMPPPPPMFDATPLTKY